LRPQAQLAGGILGTDHPDLRPAVVSAVWSTGPSATQGEQFCGAIECSCYDAESERLTAGSAASVTELRIPISGRVPGARQTVRRSGAPAGTATRWTASGRARRWFAGWF